ncbi:MAG: SCO family protein, partial [Proteobacteria bacterium]|nr:SCO family protein [Pseudomonadota bacterium]
MKKVHLISISLIALCTGFAISWMAYDSVPVKLEAGLWFGDQAKVLPDFRLIDHNNKTLGKPELTGKWSLMFFGYTHCPDVCPIGLQTLSDLLNTIEDNSFSHMIQVIFVSVDPDRDTPAVLKTYLQNFHPDIIGASASSESRRSSGSGHAQRSSPSNLLVTDIMTRPAVSISPERTVRDAWRMMARHKIHSVVVAETDKPVGILTHG